MDPEPPNLEYFIFQTVVPTSSVDILFPLVLFILLLICSGLVSASEVAYFSLGLKDVKSLEEENTDSSNRALQLKQKPRNLLATILIANNFVNIAIVIVADQILKILLGQDNLLLIGHWLYANLYGFSSPEALADIFNFLITVVGVTFILVLFGEAMPKIYATLNKLRIVHLMSGPLTLLSYTFSPISSILVGWSNAMEKRLGNNHQNMTSKEDIDTAIDLTVTNVSESSVQEADILKGIVNFGDIAARQIMHPRMDIVAIEESETFKDLMKIVKDSGYSRLPVYKDDLDNIIGILYVKDLLAFTEAPESFEWQKLIRNSVLFVPESKKIDELLREFQLKRTHMAVIVDEYGGTAGIATLEDIMEEVVGDIKDEFDQDEDIDYIKISDNNYIFEGKTLLKDVCRVIGENTNYFDENRGEADSLAGLILEVVGHIPTSEKEITIGHIVLKVITVTKRRIEKISLILHGK
ncbi:MAG TPA: gliding motility-associated protein GldE [Saprospiraceae bacterium]|nr:gliding motility-associated protein GldE [Saprospiraceae bacterium]